MSIGNLFGTGGESNSLYGTSLESGGTIPPSSFIYFEWFIFQASTGQPATPTGGSWDFLTNTGVPPTGWSSTVSGVPANNLWFSIAFVDSRNPTNIVWSTTSLISASTSVYATAYADTFTGTGSTTSWTLTADPVVVNNLDVSINGVTQTPTVDYTISGTTFTTTTAAPLGSIILVKYRQALPNSYFGTANNVGYTPFSWIAATNVQTALNEVATDISATDGVSGSNLVGYKPSGTGAVATTVQTKLRESISVTDFGADPTGVANSSTAFTNAATAAGNQSAFVPKGTYALTGSISGNFYSFGGVTISSGTVTINDLTNYQFTGGTRDAICYSSAQAVRVFRNYATMGGFRFRGQYTKGRAPTFAMPSNKVASLTTNLSAMSATTFENWYAVFACANNGDATATLKITPFLRAGVVAGSNIGLIKGGEGQTSDVTQSYSWTSPNNLAGTDLLVITENGGFSGRVTTVTANSTSSITVSTIGSIANHDTFLLAPIGYTHYVYLGTFYEDTAEVRNIYDSGTLVKSKGIYTLYPDVSTGSFATPTAIDSTGYISPLATAVVLDSSCVLSTSSAGSYAEYFDGDGSNHTLQSAHIQKDNNSNLTVVFDNIQVPFLYPQQFWYSNAGSLTATRINGQLNITGWFEP
jgi:hypothetical protein